MRLEYKCCFVFSFARKKMRVKTNRTTSLADSTPHNYKGEEMQLDKMNKTHGDSTTKRG